MQSVEAHLARHVGFRKRRALIGEFVFLADQRDLHFGVMLAQIRRCRDRRVASTDDDRMWHEIPGLDCSGSNAPHIKW
jgi:hypothetical protein